MLRTSGVFMDFSMVSKQLFNLSKNQQCRKFITFVSCTPAVQGTFSGCNNKYSLRNPQIRFFSNSSITGKHLTPEEIEQWKKDLAKMDNEHIHMRESETEINDSYRLGSMLTRKGAHLTGHTHSHGHTSESDSLTKMLLDKQEFKKNPAVRITWIGILVNIGQALGKFAGGIYFNSQALLADAVHALSDLVSDFLTLFSVKLSKKPANDTYPMGYGKVESVGGLAVSSILTFAGISMGCSSLAVICGPYMPHMLLDLLHMHSHSHGATAEIGAAWVAGASILAKEWIFQATKKVAEQENSSVLLANAWHHRVDSLTSVVALVTITGGYFFGISSLDAIGGLLVSGLVIKAGFNGLKISCQELIDKSVAKTDSRYITVETVIKDSLDKLISNNNAKKPYGLKNLTLLSAGPNLQGYVLLEVPLQRWDNVLGVGEFEIVTDHLRTVLYTNVPNIKQIHIEYVEEKPELSQEEQQEIERQKKLGSAPVPEAAIKCDDSSHTHSHGFGGHHHHHHH